MPILSWNSKHIPRITPQQLITESRYLPQSYRGAQVPGNQLIWGDNLAVMTTLLEDYEGKINLIYADPPFFSGNSAGNTSHNTQM